MALYMVFIEDAEDRDGERCIMPTSEHLEDMVVLAWQTGAYVGSVPAEGEMTP
ncbi:TPA: hypothetical protein MXU29_005545 [Klebsiella pneumoniae]|nr:hypothetical protein [Klebsiella pneumoniae]HCA6363242.1 hypothetical protein [Klebsiella pneumoniae]